MHSYKYSANMNTNSFGLFGNYVGFIFPRSDAPFIFMRNIFIITFEVFIIIMTLIFLFSSSRKTQIFAFMQLYAFRNCDIAINELHIPGAKHLFCLNINQKYAAVLLTYFKFERFNFLHLNMVRYQQYYLSTNNKTNS